MEATKSEESEAAKQMRSLAAEFEFLSSKASSILQFTVDCKELQDHLESTQRELRTRLEDRKKEAAEAKRWRLEAEEGKSYLDSVKCLIEENEEELKIREEKYKNVEKLIREKEREAEEIENRVKERSRKLSWVEMSVEKEERDVREVKDALAWFCKETKLEEKKLNGIKEMIDKKSKELYLKGDEMMVVQRDIEICDGELKEKEERLRLVQESIIDCDKMLEMKEKMIGVADAKAKEFCLLKKSMEEWCCKLEVKEREIGEWVDKLEMREKQVEFKAEEVDLIRREVLDEVQLREKRLDLLEKSLLDWEKELHSLQKSVEECSRGSGIIRDGRGLKHFMDEHLKRIDSMGTELSAILKDSSDPGKLVLDAMQGFYPENGESAFELRVRRRSCCLLLEELRRISSQVNPQVKEEATKLAANWKAKMRVLSDKDLEVLGFLWLVAAYDLKSVYDVKELKRLLSNVTHGQQAAQIALVLGITDSGSRIISPIKIEETELAVVDNAATISPPNPQSGAPRDARDSQGFTEEPSNWNLNLHNEIVAAVQSASNPEKHVLMIVQRSLDKYWTSEDTSLKKGVMSCNISILKVLITFPPLIESHVIEDPKKLGLQWKAKIRADTEQLEHVLEIAGFLLFIVAYGLLPTLNGDEIVNYLERLSHHKEAVESCQMHGFLDKILAIYIQTLVERKQLFQALGFVYKFKLLDEFTTVQVLKDYVKESRKSWSETLKKNNSAADKVEFLDSQIAGLRTVLRCIKDYNLQSAYPSKEVLLEISVVEKLRDIARDSEKYLASATRQKEHSQGKKRSSSTSSPVVQQGQRQKSKIQWMGEAAYSYRSPNFAPVHLQSTPSSALAYGQRGQIQNMATNSNEVDRYSSLASGIHGHHGHFSHTFANIAEVNPRFGAIDEIDPHVGVPGLPNPYPFTGFTPFPGRYGPY